jgi:hypothetical protein
MTPTLSATSTATHTATQSPTPTVTETPTLPGGEPWISQPYPNPVTGTTVSFNVQTPASSQVEWIVFTSAFRKVYGGSQEVTGVGVIHWDLVDRYGSPVANGLYYIKVKVDSKIKILKVLVLK